jgi:hypothetical protein
MPSDSSTSGIGPVMILMARTADAGWTAAVAAYPETCSSSSASGTAADEATFCASVTRL